MKLNTNNKAKRIFIPFCLGLTFLAVTVINIVSPSTNFNLIPVITKQGLKSDSAFVISLPLIKQYELATVKGEAVMVMKKNSLLNFIAPKSELVIDNLYALAGILICLIFCINFWNYDERKPFTVKLYNTIQWIQGILFLTWILNSVRHLIVRKSILEITNNEYSIENFPFTKPEFWLFVLITALAKIIKKGIQIQKEQELTV